MQRTSNCSKRFLESSSSGVNCACRGKKTSAYQIREEKKCLVLIKCHLFIGSWYLLKWPDFQQLKQLQERINGGVNVSCLKLP